MSTNGPDYLFKVIPKDVLLIIVHLFDPLDYGSFSSTCKEAYLLLSSPSLRNEIFKPYCLSKWETFVSENGGICGLNRVLEENHANINTMKELTGRTWYEIGFSFRFNKVTIGPYDFCLKYRNGGDARCSISYLYDSSPDGKGGWFGTKVDSIHETLYRGQLVRENRGVKAEGYGTKIYSNGVKYEGNFRHGVPHGKGKIMYKNNKEVCESEWDEGEPLSNVRSDDMLKALNSGICTNHYSLTKTSQISHVFTDAVQFCESCWKNCPRGSKLMYSEWNMNGFICGCGCQVVNNMVLE